MAAVATGGSLALLSLLEDDDVALQVRRRVWVPRPALVCSCPHVAERPPTHTPPHRRTRCTSCTP